MPSKQAKAITVVCSIRTDDQSVDMRELVSLPNKLDREILALRAHLEAAMTLRFKELLSSSNLPSTFSPKLISIKASTSSALNSRENKQRDIGLLKHWMSRSSVGLQEKRKIYVLCYQHYNMCVFILWILHDHIQHDTYLCGE